MVLPFVRDLFTDVEKLPAFSRVASHLREGTGRICVSGLIPTAKALLLVLLQKAAALDPTNPDTLFALGQELLRSSDRDGAIAQWRKVIEIKPDHAEALYNLSRQLAVSDPQEAQQFQRRFDTLQSQKRIMDRAQTLGNFGLSAAAAHDWPQAIAQLKEGLQVCGHCSALALLHKNLGLIYCRSGDLKNGLAELLEAKKLTPQDPDIDQAIRFVNSAQK